MTENTPRDLLGDDRIWGTVLIILGIVSIVFRPFEPIDRALHGESDQVLTALLLILAAGIVWLAINGRPAMKALAVIWIITP